VLVAGHEDEVSASEVSAPRRAVNSGYIHWLGRRPRPLITPRGVGVEGKVRDEKGGSASARVQLCGGCGGGGGGGEEATREGGNEMGRNDTGVLLHCCPATWAGAHCDLEYV
jgi:hypothetical protein